MYPKGRKEVSVHRDFSLPTERAYGLRACPQIPRIAGLLTAPTCLQLRSLGRDPSPKQGCLIPGRLLQEILVAGPCLALGVAGRATPLCPPPPVSGSGSVASPSLSQASLAPYGPSKGPKENNEHQEMLTSEGGDKTLDADECPQAWPRHAGPTMTSHLGVICPNPRVAITSDDRLDPDRGTEWPGCHSLSASQHLGTPTRVRAKWQPPEAVCPPAQGEAKLTPVFIPWLLTTRPAHSPCQPPVATSGAQGSWLTSGRRDVNQQGPPRILGHEPHPCGMNALRQDPQRCQAGASKLCHEVRSSHSAPAKYFI